MARNNNGIKPEKPLSAEQAYQLNELSQDTNYQSFQDSLGAYGQSAEYQASLRKNPAAWRQLADIPGSAAAITNNASTWGQTTKNPGKIASSLDKLKPRENAPASQVVVPDEVLAPEQRDPNALGLEASVDLAPITEQLDRAQMSMEESIQKLETANEPYLRGEIPEDVQSQLRRTASERIQQSGIGGQVAEARSARDFGLTSLQIQEAGFQRQVGIAEARRAQASFLESRREYEKNYQLQSRQFVEDMRRTDLQATEMDQIRRRFNAEQNLNLVKLIADLASTRAQVRAQYDVADVEGGGATVAGLNNVIGQIDKIISRPGRVT